MNHQIHLVCTKVSTNDMFSNGVFLLSERPFPLIKKNLGWKSFPLGHWCPRFGLLETSDLGFKVRVDPFCVLTCLHDLQIHLWCDTCWLQRGLSDQRNCRCVHKHSWRKTWLKDPRPFQSKNQPFTQTTTIQSRSCDVNVSNRITNCKTSQYYISKITIQYFLLAIRTPFSLNHPGCSRLTIVSLSNSPENSRRYMIWISVLSVFMQFRIECYKHWCLEAISRQYRDIKSKRKRKPKEGKRDFLWHLPLFIIEMS